MATGGTHFLICCNMSHSCQICSILFADHLVVTYHAQSHTYSETSYEGEIDSTQCKGGTRVRKEPDACTG
ncbi:hypothetical protein BDR03DRAFT_958084 [Suillus americanus]|nr:hypothetical protein BDR03DRAFT_958084 [Suillus americanus]